MVPNWFAVRSRLIGPLIVAVALSPVVLPAAHRVAALDNGRIPAGGVLRITVPEAIGGKTVVGQLTVDRVDAAGYVTAYGCDDDFPVDASGNVGRSDLNYDGAISPVASNRLIVKADNNGDVCFFTLRAAAIIVDVNAVTFDTGINSFPNRRTDTRTGPNALVAAGGVLRVPVPEAVGGKTVVGQLTVDRVAGAGYVTAYGCDDGIPTDPAGVNRSDLNYDSAVSPVASNRLIVKADKDGDICFYTLRAAALIVDIKVSDGASPRPTIAETRASPPIVPAMVSCVSVPKPRCKTVVGQLPSIDRRRIRDGIRMRRWTPATPAAVGRSDVSFDGAVSPSPRTG